MSSQDVEDCLAAERSFPLDGDVTASVEMVLACPSCGSEHHITTITWPGHAEYFSVSCIACAQHIRRVRCDVGVPLLSGVIVAERLRKNWRHVFSPFHRPSVGTT